MKENDEEESWDEQRNEALKQKADFESLTNNPGWKRLCEWLNGQIRVRTDELVLQPCKGTQHQFEQEYKKGEIAAMRLIQRIVEVGLEEATEVARSLQDVESSDSPTDSGAAFD